MEATKSLATGLLLAGVLMSFMSTSAASDFIVGGRAGRVQSPVVPYNNWASAMRLLVNDSLVFKYKKGDDSVLVLNKSGYESRNTTGPLVKLAGRAYLAGPAGRAIKGAATRIIKGAATRIIKGAPKRAIKGAAERARALPPSITTPPAMPFFATTPSPSPSAETPTMVSPIMAPLSSPNSRAEEPMPLVSPSGPGLPPVSAPSPADKGSSPSPSPSAEVPMMVSPTPALPPADKGSSSSVLSASGVTMGMATMLLGGVLFG